MVLAMFISSFLSSLALRGRRTEFTSSAELKLSYWRQRYYMVLFYMSFGSDVSQIFAKHTFNVLSANVRFYHKI